MCASVTSIMTNYCFLILQTKLQQSSWTISLSHLRELQSFGDIQTTARFDGLQKIRKSQQIDEKIRDTYNTKKNMKD